MTSQVHDFVLYFSKTFGALYLFSVFLIALVWTYWPTRRAMYEDAAYSPLGQEEISNETRN